MLEAYPLSGRKSTTQWWIFSRVSWLISEKCNYQICTRTIKDHLIALDGAFQVVDRTQL
jgi:hypothetical protein